MELDEARDSGKQQFHGHVPKRIAALKFGVLSGQDIVSQSVAAISDRHLYDLYETSSSSRPVTRNGPLDQRLGTSQSLAKCETCNRLLAHCNGHFGHVRLALPVFHVGFMKRMIEILHCICKECARVLLVEESQTMYLKLFRRSNIDNLQREQISKKVMTEAKKCSKCYHCGATNGAVRKVSGHALKIIHDKYKAYVQSTAKNKKPPQSLVDFEASFDQAKKGNPELERNLKRAVDDLNPLRVLDLLRRVIPADCEILGMKPSEGLPDMLICQYVPAPPVTIRPSVQQDNASTEDDLTNKLGDIIQISSIIEAGIRKGQPIQTIMEQWDFLQIQVAIYINSDLPHLLQSGFGKPIRGLCQRLKGKQGRFRGNLSGKRVDFSARTVISPDPNLEINEVAVPKRVATILTYPEQVTKYNLAKLRDCVKRGNKHPGATTIIKKGKPKKINLEVWSRRKATDKLQAQADRLQIGDVVERHLEDGDIVLFNRQPSLHKLSIMCHRVQVRDWRTFRLNECVCTPYNADFDGDEMNLHVPQNESARAEALTLMDVKHNLATPKDGTPIVAATQDFITAAYLLSNKDKFYDRKSFSQICSYMFDGDAIFDGTSKTYGGNQGRATKSAFDIDLPDPAIIKPECLWTGKQVFNVLMNPSKMSKVKVNFDAACKEYKRNPRCLRDLDEEDNYVCIRNSEIMVGMMDKAILGSGRKNSIFYVMLRDFGPEYAVQAMSRMAKLAARWLTNEGFSIGVNDVYPDESLRVETKELIDIAYAQCDDIIAQFKASTIGREGGWDEEQTMENKITKKLNEVRQRSAALCFENLSRWNSAVLMAKAGAKGANINVAQMVATVGQQIIGGSRVADGFQDRTLPHFPKAARQPPSKGFVRNSFFSGLTPMEFVFHAMSGREGLVDTAVKTAETGYMSRRLIKSLEDLSAQYDNTIKNSTNNIVQFQYGEDRLDPVDMEGKATPVDFERTFLHTQVAEWNSRDPCLLPHEVESHTKRILGKERKRLGRHGLNGATLPYRLSDCDEVEVDQYESNRYFLDEVEHFVSQKAEALAKARQHMAQVPGRTKEAKVEGRATDQGKQASLVHGTAKISAKSLKKFLELCIFKFEKAKVEPGHAVGAIGAQSIGEPGTQMTLKTFHFAGVAGMSITQGVPRIKEIINASKIISTPVITCQIYNERNERVARMVKGQIEKTYLRDVMTWISECWTDIRSYLRIKVDFDTINDLELNLTMDDISRAIRKTRGLPLSSESIKISGPYMNITLDDPPDVKKTKVKGKTKDKEEEHFIRLQNLKRQLPNVVIKGYPDAVRAIIAKKLKSESESPEETEILVEGYGLRQCMNTDGVDGCRTSTNSVMETREVLGIEAARSTIIRELNSVMGTQMEIDPRHMQLLADVMTCKGEVLGITRFGLAKMRDSVLQLASFEKTPDHLFDAAVKGKEDKIRGVSECIIMGQSISIGTGAMQVLKDMGWRSPQCVKRSTMFEDAFETAKGSRR